MDEQELAEGQTDGEAIRNEAIDRYLQGKGSAKYVGS